MCNRQVKTVLLSVLLLALRSMLPCGGATAQENLSRADSLKIFEALSYIDSVATDPEMAAMREREERSHRGWKASPFPILSYNSDLGVQLGAFVDIYDYGKKPSIYPEYFHKFHVEGSYYTKGQLLVDAEYDSSHLIPGVRSSISVTYSRDPLCQFFGFGGDVEKYDRSLDRRDGNACYSMNRNMLRVLSAFQGEITPTLSWVGGISFWNYATADISFKDYRSDNTLYHRYVESGVISPGEAGGGSVLELKAGLALDTRDFEPSPTKGIRSELYFCGCPGVGGNSYLKLCAHFRGFWTPGPEWMTLAAHLAYQGVIAGSQPFYTMQHIYTLTPLQCYAEGLGGLNTVRGIMSARLLGDGYAWGNFEARFRIVTINLQGYELYLAANPFVDLGCIVQPARIGALSAAYGKSEAELMSLARRVHVCPGGGVKFGFNRNTIMSVEVAKSISDNDGPVSVVVSMNYIF